jgi:hypothetical protein
MLLKSLQIVQKGLIFSLENALVDSITSYIVCVCVCPCCIFPLFNYMWPNPFHKSARNVEFLLNNPHLKRLGFNLLLLICNLKKRLGLLYVVDTYTKRISTKFTNT